MWQGFAAVAVISAMPFISLFFDPGNIHTSRKNFMFIFPAID